MDFQWNCCCNLEGNLAHPNEKRYRNFYSEVSEENLLGKKLVEGNPFHKRTL